MFFCPKCNNSFDITKTGIQKGGVLNSESSDSEETTSSSSKKPSDVYDILINKIMNDDDVKQSDIIKINMTELVKHPSYRKLKSTEKEYVSNMISDLIPKDQKKIMEEKTDKLSSDNLAYFQCNNCGFMEKITPNTLIYSKTSQEISQNYSVGDYKDMIYSDIIPRTKNYLCPNKTCLSHTDINKKEAVFFRRNNTYEVKYVCTVCKTDFN